MGRIYDTFRFNHKLKTCGRFCDGFVSYKKGSLSQMRGTKSQVFAFFESFDSQKQPETAQKVDLMLRDMNPGRDESKSSGSCRAKSVKTGWEVGWTWPNVTCHGCACYLADNIILYFRVDSSF
jgi:hypothetical protein